MIGRLTSSHAVRWTALALLGVVIAVAVGVIASQVASQRIGLASEPVRAGETLAPSSTSPGHGGGSDSSGGGSDSGGPSSGGAGTGPTTTTTSTTTTVPSTTTSSTTGDDYGDGEGGDD